jgi:hypothetical protein
MSMLKDRIRRIEAQLQRQAQRPLVWTPVLCVKGLRELLARVGGQGDGILADPFPFLEGEDYLLAFWPWLLANASRFPRWALEYAFRLGGMALGDASRWIERGQPPARRLQTASDVVDLLEEQVAALRLEQGMEAGAKARAIGYLAGIARKAIETGTLAARLDMLETVLQSRTKDTKAKP